MSTEYRNWLPTLCTLADTAGARIMDVYRSDFDVEQKEDDSPVTAADQAAHRVLVDGLRALTPDIPILSEEGEQPTFAVRQAWQRYWLIDPLDGTREFIKRNDEFTVNIALVEDRKSTRLNSSHVAISYAVFCLKKKRPIFFQAVTTHINLVTILFQIK